MTTNNSIRLLAISDIQGNLNSLKEIYDNKKYDGNEIDYIVHTGNFGFWNKGTIERNKDLHYLKQIIAFLTVLKKNIVEELNDLSTIFGQQSIGSNSDNVSNEYSQFKEKLLDDETNSISELDLYLNGEIELPCPVYTTFGPLDDPIIIDKFQSGEYKIPNLYILDHLNQYEIKNPSKDGPNIRLYGIGGNVKIHSLFDNGNLNLNNISGKTGDLWITLIQIAELYNKIKLLQEQDLQTGRNTINIFISYAPVIKTPLLEHLSIITNADFTISQGLHFRYPVMGNGMSFVDSMGGSAGYIENYRSKFSRLRLILGEFWLIIKDDINDILKSYENSNELSKLIELGLSLFDKIPIAIDDEITPLSLYDVEESKQKQNDEDNETNKKIIKKINDYYFSAYYNLWHFNLCNHLITDYTDNDETNDDGKNHDYNIMIFKLTSNGNFKLDYCSSQGFNFKFKQKNQTNMNNEISTRQSKTSLESHKSSFSYNAIEYSPKTGIKKSIVLNQEKSDNEHDESMEADISQSEYNDENDEAIIDDENNLSKTKHLINTSTRGNGNSSWNPYKGNSSRGRGAHRGRGRGGSRGSIRGHKSRGRGKSGGSSDENINRT